jgi:ApaG protein
VLPIINADIGRHWTPRNSLWHHPRIVDTTPSKSLVETDPAYKIRVDVETSYLEEQSDPRERKFVFSYTITLRNEGSVPAKLLTRHWIITDANGKVQEVRGDGVVGEQPHLKPGQGFRYSSGAMIETPVGAMQGSYQMVADDGSRFDAPIAPFRLAMPGIVQ